MRIALFEPEIPQNTGNIFRLGACLNISIDIIGPAYFLNDKRFRRASMDYIKYTKYKNHLDWDSFIRWSKKNNFRLLLITTKTKKKYFKFKFKKKDIIIFGNESSGVPKYIHDNVYEKLTIPMVKGLRSINVSSSVAIVIGEACRQLSLI